MKEELKKVLELVEQGKITSAQGAELIEAMGIGDSPASGTPAPAMRRMLKIHVISGKGDKVDVKLPVSLLKVGMGFGKAYAVKAGGENEALKQLDWDELMVAVNQMIEDNELGEIVTVTSADGDTINVWLE